MNIVLGSGITGLIVAQALRKQGRPYVLLDRIGVARSGSSMGFFYAHGPNAFTGAQEYPILSTCCPGGSEGKYRAKVYGPGEALDGPISYSKYAAGGRVGSAWLYALERLTEGLGGASIEEETYAIDREARVIYGKSGRSWTWRNGGTLYSTIPLPALLRMAGILTNPFHSSPIYITPHPFRFVDGVPWGDVGSDSVHVHYCASDCHSWYRATRLPDSNMARLESMKPEEGAVKVSPGKIWFQNSHEREIVEEIREIFMKPSGISLQGRYGRWFPKYLTSDTVKEFFG